MGRLMLDPSTPTTSARTLRDRLVTLLDAATVLAVLLLVSNVLFEGFRLRIGDVRVTATSPVRTALIAIALAGIRHWLARRPTLPERLARAVGRAWASPARGVVLPAFVASRGMVLAIGFLAVVLVGYAPKAPPVRISRNELVNLPLRWDAGWYLQLALEGYHYRQEHGAGRQQNIAFFPAYPLLTRVGAAWLGMRSSGFGDEIRGNRAEWQYFQHRRIVLAAMVVSLGAFAWALVYLFRLARELFDDDAARGAVLIASAYPYALFFSAMYTESLFLLVSVAAFYHVRRREYLSASVWGLLAGLTRPNGCLLSVPLALLVVQQSLAAAPAAGGALQARRLMSRRFMSGLAAAATPGIGMLLFSAYLYQLTGRPLAWMDAHQAWGRVATDVEALVADRMTFIFDRSFYAYSAEHSIELLNAVPALAALVLAIPIARRAGLAYGLLIAVMLLPPLLRGGFLSLGRVTATLFPLFLYGGWLLRGDARSAVVLGFAALQGFLAVIFFTWRPFY
jgi:hypothetical protein